MPPNAPVFGYMNLQRETTLLHTTSSASNGTWDGIVIIRVINGKPETREIVQGRFFSDDSTLTIDEASVLRGQFELRQRMFWPPIPLVSSCMKRAA
jgi:hypothetical protein